MPPTDRVFSPDQPPHLSRKAASLMAPRPAVLEEEVSELEITYLQSLSRE